MRGRAAKPERRPRADPAFARAATRLAAVGRQFHARGWAPGTAGNYSAVVSRDPLRLAITASGRDKTELGARDVVEIDGDGKVRSGAGRPSAETPIHLAIVRATGCGAVLHTHSVWGTLLSSAAAAESGIAFEDYELLAGLDGVATHETREWLPVFSNARDWTLPAKQLEAELRLRPEAHGFLLRRHGLYAWGRDIEGARRHVEILEFLLEAEGRRRGAGL